jgi:thioesterase domain-containing protein
MSNNVLIYFLQERKVKSWLRFNHSKPDWQEWEHHLPNVRVIDMDAAGHVTMLFEQKALEAIHALCQHLYRTDEVDEQ